MKTLPSRHGCIVFVAHASQEVLDGYPFKGEGFSIQVESSGDPNAKVDLVSFEDFKKRHPNKFCKIINTCQ
jgi:hypothetical protein